MLTKFFKRGVGKVIIGVVLFLALATPVLAVSSSTFLPKAQKYIDNNCSKRSLNNEKSLLCYLFSKTGEQTTKIQEQEITINNLETKLLELEEKNSSQSATILDLQERINQLEN